MRYIQKSGITNKSVSGDWGAYGFFSVLSRRAYLLTTHKMGGGIPFGVVRSARLCGSVGALCTMPHFFKLLSLSTQFLQVQPLMRL